MRCVAVIAASVVVAVVLFGLVGCGYILYGTTQEITVYAEPAGTSVESSPGAGEFITPTILTLNRNTFYVLTFSREGYKPAAVKVEPKIQPGIVLLDIVGGLLVGVYVDAEIGSWNKLQPDEVSVSLEKMEDAPTDGPGSVEIYLRSKHGFLKGLVVESTEPVLVTVEPEH